jgi:hypothetical protein
MKKLLSLLLIFALLCSAMLVLSSCDEPDDGLDDGGDGTVDVPEGDLGIVTDPKDPEAGGSESDENYIKK